MADYNSRPYKDAALAAAKLQGLTPEQVDALDYPKTATLAGVKIGADGSSPASFVPAAIRNYVAGQLRAELRAAFWEGIRAHTEGEVRKEPGLEDATVEMDQDGSFRVLKDDAPVAVRSIF